MAEFLPKLHPSGTKLQDSKRSLMGTCPLRLRHMLLLGLQLHNFFFKLFSCFAKSCIHPCVTYGNQKSGLCKCYCDYKTLLHLHTYVEIYIPNFMTCGIS